MNPYELPTASSALPSWQILAWPPVRLGISDWRDSSRNLCHLSSTMERNRAGRLQGQVLWAGRAGGSMVGLAWDWMEALNGVPTLLDPMSVLSNMELVDADGQRLSDGEQLLHVNGSVYCLPWQEHLYETV